MHHRGTAAPKACPIGGWRLSTSAVVVVIVVVVACASSATVEAAASDITDETGRLLLKSGWDTEDCSCSITHFDYTGAWSHDYSGRACVR